MKKSILSFLLVLISVFSSLAETERVPVRFGKDSRSTENEPRHRIPVYIDVEVEYDSQAQTISVSGDESIEAEVFLYDVDGVLMDYSSSVNTVFYVTNDGDYTISIVGEDWSGEGIITVEN